MELKVDSRDELDSVIRNKILNKESINEPELLGRITDIMIERDILVDDVQCYHDRLKSISDENKARIGLLSEYIKERMASDSEEPKKVVEKFIKGYVVVDTTDNHVLDNMIFKILEDAKKLKKRYEEELPSIVENSYEIVTVTNGCIEYGSFPYEDQMYLIYDIPFKDGEC